MTAPGPAGPATGPSAAATPIVIGRRTLRVLSLAFLATIALTAVAMAMEHDAFMLLLLAVAELGLLLVLAPSVLFLVHSIKHRREGVGSAMRRSATGSGIALILIGLFAFLIEDVPLFSYSGPVLMVVGVAVIVRAWTAARPEPGTADRFALRHRGSTLGGALVAAVVMAIVPKFAGVKTPAIYLSVSRADLRNLVLAQEAFFTDSGRYTSSLSSLEFRPSTGATTPRITVGKDWWTATNAHTSVPDVLCGVGVNANNPVVGVSAESGEPACR
jgi:hypothetical protein